MKAPLHVGRARLHAPAGAVTGRIVRIEGEPFYQIANHDRLRPFFLTVVSDADHWLFISSNGALTAGRRTPDHALFPYYTDDKIHDSAEITGSKTILLVRQRHQVRLWEPFSERYRGAYRIERNLYKNFTGNQLLFEEINHDLALTFRHGWATSERFGFVRRAWLTNQGTGTARVSLLDGVQNILPSGVGSQFQLEKSTLLDAYKKNELLPGTGLGLFLLSSIPIDRPEPAEALRATTVWSLGLKRRATLLSARQLDRFRDGLPLHTETDLRAERGAYFVQTDLTLRAGQRAEWLIVADVQRGPADVAFLNRQLRSPHRLQSRLAADVARGAHELRRLIASADGLQQSARPLGDARHASNTLFNIMRGGVFADGSRIDPADLCAFVTHANRAVATRHASFFRRLKPGVTYSTAVALAGQTDDPQLERLCREYLPLTFSRRHGDPSRPWNRFAIAGRKPDGGRAVGYEGNWRDIFQNWEALARSFPGFVSGMICRFVNASTADGYNPYRITRDGIDWEVVEPHDPWSFIGYWGDHQIIYLLKLLEIFNAHEPAALRALLDREIFCYANVPYRIKPYAELRHDPRDTVVFDQATEELVERRVRAAGGDGKLVWGQHGEVRLVSLTEKLLVPILAKLTNFVPGAGIWLNTQRPEWNDANNALVGNGASVVTLCHLRRMLTFCLDLFATAGIPEHTFSTEVAAHLNDVARIVEREATAERKSVTDRDRHRVLESLGRAGSRYRGLVYAHGLSGRKQTVGTARLIRFFTAARHLVDQTLRANRRPDGLYHSYNLLRLDKPGVVSVRPLYEMLEGQVAILSSGLLSPAEAADVLTALRRSRMYRADQHSYLLYPDRQLPRFMEKNNLPANDVKRSALLRRLLADGNHVLVEGDPNGHAHFNGDIRNARDVAQRLDQLAAAGYAGLVRRDRAFVLDRFEHLFDHASFTGRSGTFFGYEGLGCIYWHMVSKLLLAAQENFHQAIASGAPASVIRRLMRCYNDIRAGLGDRKTPADYGAFPTDPYSHTPGQGGARQPGLTGQVKEDILCRLGELGVFIESGQLHFRPMLLHRDEFLPTPGHFDYFDVTGRARRLRLPAPALAFTCCQTPIIYQLGERNALTVHFQKGRQHTQRSLQLDAETSRHIFTRSGFVTRIHCVLGEASLSRT